VSSTGIKHFLNFVKRAKHCLNCDFIEYDLLTLTKIKKSESEPFDYALDPANGGKRWHRN
jgi:hypothetical protein